MGENVKTYILMTFDLENVLIDPKINRLCLCPISFLDAKYRPLGLTMPEKGGRQTHRHTHTHSQTELIIL